MCHLSMKLFDMFDQTTPSYNEQNSGKTHTNEKRSQSLNLSPKCQGHNKTLIDNIGGGGVDINIIL